MQPEKDERLRHVLPLVNRWLGGTAKLWSYSVSLRSLVIRIEAEGRRGNLHIGCGDVSHITGPTKWDNAHIEIESADKDTWIVRDRRAGFEVRAGTVGAAENCKPVY
jgi:hypothetical protein